MKHSIIVAMAVVLATFAVSSTVQAAGIGQGALTPTLAALIGPHAEGEAQARYRKHFENRGKKKGHPGLNALIRVAVTAPWAREDAEVQRLVDQGIADRKTMIRAESNRLAAFEDLVAGLRSGKTKDELEAEVAALKAAGEAIKEAHEKIRDDVKALAERLKEIRPEREGAGEGGWGGGERKKNRRNGNDDWAPMLD